MTGLRNDNILRLPDVKRRTGLSRPTIYRKMEAGTFPGRVQLSVNCVGWYETDVLARISDPASYLSRPSTSSAAGRKSPESMSAHS